MGDRLGRSEKTVPKSCFNSASSGQWPCISDCAAKSSDETLGMSAPGHSRPNHFVPVLNNVRYASDSDHSSYESELTLWARSGLMQCDKIRETQRAVLQRTAISQALRNDLVGTAEQKRVSIRPLPSTVRADDAVSTFPSVKARPSPCRNSNNQFENDFREPSLPSGI
jgi:hypothetical protein